MTKLIPGTRRSQEVAGKAVAQLATQRVAELEAENVRLRAGLRALWPRYHVLLHTASVHESNAWKCQIPECSYVAALLGGEEKDE